MDPSSLEALNELRDIHAPAPISWWPPAPGWWILLALFLLTLVAWFGVRHFQKRTALKKNAIAELEQIKTTFRENHDPLQLAVQLSILLRRVAVSGEEREKAAALKGEEWLAFLDETGQTKIFSEGAGRVLISAPYQPKVDLDAPALIDAVEAWIKKNTDAYKSGKRFK